MNHTHLFTAMSGSIDKENGVIHGVSVVSIGIAEGHDMQIDATTLEQVKAAAARAGSLQVKIDHWSGFDGIVGTLQNFGIESDRLRADLHLLDNHPARSRVLEMAEKMPGNFGLSIVFSGEPELKDGAAFARCSELFSVDLVDRPAANPTGLFAAGVDMMELRRTHLAEIESFRVHIHSLELKALERESAFMEIQRQNDLLKRECASLKSNMEMLASRRAAEIVSSTGTTTPAAISPRGDEQDFINKLRGLELAKAANNQRHKQA